jgi:hypothetical protein
MPSSTSVFGLRNRQRQPPAQVFACVLTLETKKIATNILPKQEAKVSVQN